MSNVFGQPELQEEVKTEGNNSTIITVLLVIIVAGGAVLAYLLYRQSQEPPIVLDEVVETIELPTEGVSTEVTNELPTIPTSPSE
ncbi:MAG: hypothetical protein RLZZ223_149 [Candidatus Parcubacteria bacterium]|jgi:hypothetical protein